MKHMKSYMEEYYYMSPTGDDSPLLDFIDAMTDSFMLYKEHALDETHLVKFRFGDPIPHNPQMGDVHNYAYHLVISDKLKQTMQAMLLKDVQYLPASIKNTKNGDVYDGYWVLHIHNLIDCLDRERSEFSTRRNGNIVSIYKLCLDNDKLDKIPLEKRLVFALGEHRLKMFFHVSVVEKLMKLKLVGVEFYSLAEELE